MRKLSALTRKSFYSLVLGFLVVSVFLLTFSVNVIAADGTSYFPMHQNNNGIFTDFVKNSIDNYLDADNNFIFCEYWAIDNDYFTTYYVKWPKNDGMQLFAEINSNGYQFSLYRSNQSNFTIGYLNINLHNGTVSDYSATFDHFYNLFSNSYYPTCDYISNFRLYTNNTLNRDVVLNYGYSPDVDGHAVHPHFDGLHPHYGNTVQPSQVPPTYTINNYSWTTYNSPSIDTSSVESLLESLIYVINYLAGWLSSNLSAEFSNLTDNLEGFFSYIGQTLQYYGDLIIDNIQNGIQNLYDNFKSVLEPVGVIAATIVGLGTDPETGLFSVPYLTRVLLIPDASHVTEAFMDHDEFGFIPAGRAARSALNNIYLSLSDLTPIKSFHVPGVTWHGVVIGNFDLDFSWYDNFKTYGDGIITVFLTVSWVYWVILNLSNWLRGSASVGSDVSKLEK